MSWRQRAADAIHKALQSLDDKATIDEKVAAIDAAYPFGMRANHPYKIWLSERRIALGRLGVLSKKARQATPLLSPLEKAKQRGLELMGG